MISSAAELRERSHAAGVPDQVPAIAAIFEAADELEHQGMEPGAYSVSMEQWFEVALDLILVIAFSEPV